MLNYTQKHPNFARKFTQKHPKFYNYVPVNKSGQKNTLPVLEKACLLHQHLMNCI